MELGTATSAGGGAWFKNAASPNAITDIIIPIIKILYAIPTIIFLLSSVSTIIVAILATRPKVTGGTFNEDDIINKKTNLLFFGNFHRVPQEKYEF